MRCRRTLSCTGNSAEGKGRQPSDRSAGFGHTKTRWQLEAYKGSTPLRLHEPKFLIIPCYLMAGIPTNQAKAAKIGHFRLIGRMTGVKIIKIPCIFP
jgi:hypothetical protein